MRKSTQAKLRKFLTQIVRTRSYLDLAHLPLNLICSSQLSGNGIVKDCQDVLKEAISLRDTKFPRFTVMLSIPLAIPSGRTKLPRKTEEILRYIELDTPPEVGLLGPEQINIREWIARGRPIVDCESQFNECQCYLRRSVSFEGSRGIMYLWLLAGPRPKAYSDNMSRKKKTRLLG